MDRSGDEQGAALVEVLVSAIVLVITAIGVFSAFDAATRSTSEQRHRSQANGLAQADLARMRTMRISDLSPSLNETKVVTIDGTPYTVKSLAQAEDETGTTSCKEGEVEADYIQIRSTVTWPSIGTREAVVAQSLVAPPNGSVSPSSGALAIQIEGAANQGIADVGLSVSGPKSFTGSTGPGGCAIFGNLPAGSYALTVVDSTLVDKEGNSPEEEPTSVVAEGTNTLALQYDKPGELAVDFETRVDGELVPSSAESVVVFNSGMTLAKTFGTPDTPQEKVTATPLFPFLSPYAVHVGKCKGNDPNQLAAGAVPAGATADAVVPAGEEAQATIELPALDLEVWSGTDAANAEALVEGAVAKVTDRSCEGEGPGEGKPVIRTYATDQDGGLPDPGLPYGTYEVCIEGAGKAVSVSGLKVPADPKDLVAGTTLDVYLGAAEAGECA